MQEQLDKDLKQAMLAGEKAKVEVIKGLKNAIQYEAVAQGAQDKGLSDEEIQKVLSKEAKKRAEAIELYEKAGENDRAAAEKAEKDIIDSYLPEQASEDDIKAAVEEAMKGLEAPSAKDMGQIIGKVRAKLGSGADGATIVRLAKEKIG